MLSLEDYRHLRNARGLTQTSDDPSTRVGCIILTADRRKIIYGVNALPVGIRRNLAALPREDRLKLIVHAEMDAICTAARFGDCLLGSTMYIMAYNVADGKFWGGAPCTGCIKHVIAAGVQRVVSISRTGPDRWAFDCQHAQELLEEAGLLYEEGDYDHI